MKKNKKRKPRVAKNRKTSRSRRSTKSYKSTKFSDPLDPWVPSWKTVTIAGRRIRGMVYLEPSLEEYYSYRYEVGILNPQLPVANSASDFDGKGFLTVFPIYAYCTEETRATYLDWLVERNSTQYSTKYVLMYFSGLERRFFFDYSTPSEQKSIVAEAERLLDIYRYDSIIDSLLGSFVSIGKVILGLQQEVVPTSRRPHPNHDAVLAEIGMRIDRGKGIDGQSLLNLYVIETKIRTSICRMFPEFKALFISLFEEKYPRGMRIESTSQYLQPEYRSVCFNQLIDLHEYIGSVSNIYCERMPFTVAEQIAGQAAKLLAKFSRYIGKDPKLRESFEAHLLLPHEIRDQFPCAKAAEIVLWAKNQTQSDETVCFGQVVEKLKGAPVDNLTKSEKIKIIDTLENLFITLVPDPRLTMYNLKLADPVYLHKSDKSMTLSDKVSEEYWNTFRQLAVACFVIQGNHVSDGSEWNPLIELISQSEASLAERLRLTNHLSWMLCETPKLPMLRQNLKALSPSAKQELVPIALSMAVFQGGAPPRRVEAVKQIYKLLGQDVANVYTDLHSIMTGDEPVIVRSESQMQQAFVIPRDGVDHSRVELDFKRVDSVLSDTDRVSAVLGEIFSSGDHTIENDEPENSYDLFPGLDERHASLILELIQRSHWDEEEFSQLAERFNLMPGGALETLNEWAFEKFEEPLMEEYDGYNLNLELVGQLETI